MLMLMYVHGCRCTHAYVFCVLQCVLVHEGALTGICVHAIRGHKHTDLCTCTCLPTQTYMCYVLHSVLVPEGALTGRRAYTQVQITRLTVYVCVSVYLYSMCAYIHTHVHRGAYEMHMSVCVFLHAHVWSHWGNAFRTLQLLLNVAALL